jgi:hypothetical protein
LARNTHFGEEILPAVHDARKNEPILQFVSFHVTTKKTIVPVHRVKESIPQTKGNYNFFFPSEV